jgi:LacI family transcriptional regulator
MGRAAPQEGIMSAEEQVVTRRRRAGMQEVAALAGVGMATVDRVLNERGSVRVDTARRVIEAARTLGIRRTLPIPYHRKARLAVLLARQAETPFLVRLTQAFVRVSATLDRSVTVLRTTLDQAKPQLVARRIRETTADGLLLYCEEHPTILAAIAGAIRRGLPVVCLTTDLPSVPRLAYVGIDHTRAGRTAALFVALVARGAGSALVLTSDLGYRAHKERLAGFEEGLALHAPQIRIARVLHGYDDPTASYRLVSQELRRQLGIIAIYNTGGANRAVAAAIRDQRRVGSIAFVGHELTEASSTLLRDGVMTLAIDQAPELQARRAIETMLKHLGMFEAELQPNNIPFTLHTRENAGEMPGQPPAGQAAP